MLHRLVWAYCSLWQFLNKRKKQVIYTKIPRLAKRGGIFSFQRVVSDKIFYDFIGECFR